MKELDLFKDEINLQMMKDLDDVRTIIYNKFYEIINCFKQNQLEQRAVNAKLKDELNTLRRDKIDICQKLIEVKKRIIDMEFTIGDEELGDDDFMYEI